MIISLQTRSDLAEDLRSESARSPQGKRICDILHSFHVALRPTFPGISEPEFRSHFYAEVDDDELAQRLREHLAAVEGVESAYIKSPGQAPS